MKRGRGGGVRVQQQANTVEGPPRGTTNELSVNLRGSESSSFGLLIATGAC